MGRSNGSAASLLELVESCEQHRHASWLARRLAGLQTANGARSNGLTSCSRWADLARACQVGGRVPLRAVWRETQLRRSSEFGDPQVLHVPTLPAEPEK